MNLNCHVCERLLRDATKNAMPKDNMRLTCPSCSTEYDVPDAALAGRGRKLRCERCGHAWRSAEAASVKDWPVPAAPAWPDDRGGEGPAALEGREPEALPEPEPLPELEPAPEVTARQFGHPVDEAALVEIQHAVDEEEKIHPAHDADAEDATVIEPAPATAPPEDGIADGLPLFLTAARGPDTVMLNEVGAYPPANGYDDLVNAARNKAVEYEPESAKPGPILRTGSSPFFILLIVLFVLACIALEHKAVEHVLPGSAKFFNSLGLK